MARRKDVNWNLAEPGQATVEQMQVAVLMDLRDELKKLNELLHCYKFQSIPDVLKGIRRKIPSPEARKPRVNPRGITNPRRPHG